MTQMELADKLEDELGFVRPAKGIPGTTTAGGRPKRRRVSKRSFTLAPPGLMLLSQRLLHIDSVAGSVDPGQLRKIHEETGLTFEHLKALVKGDLDRDVVRLIFYCHRVALISSDDATLALICDFTSESMAAQSPPTIPSAFWSGKRRKFRPTVKALRDRIRKNRRLTTHEEVTTCLEDFVAYIDAGWALSS